jgi:hypothetical protein
MQSTFARATGETYLAYVLTASLISRFGCRDEPDVAGHLKPQVDRDFSL